MPRLLLLPALFSLLVAIASAASPEFPQAPSLNFANVVAYPSGGYAQSVAVADVNRDGKPDLLVANGCLNISSGCRPNGSVSVLLGNGDGTFQSPVTYSSGGVLATAVVVADLNHDGKLDLLVSNLCATTQGSCSVGAIGVLLGNGDGTFQPAASYSSVGFGAISLAVADFNRDGNLDVVATNMQGPSVAVLLGNGDGTFQTALTYDSAGDSPVFVAAADLNGDGKVDILVSNECGTGSGGCGVVDGTVAILLGNGDGTFQPAVTYDSGGYFAGSIALADVNQDGKLDLLVTNGCHLYNCGFTSGSVGVLLASGNGTFQPPVAYSSGGVNAQSLAVQDIDGDGKLDIVVNNQCPSDSLCPDGGNVAVLLGKGNGNFQSPVTFSSGGFDAFGLAVADFNADGKPDIAVANACNVLELNQVCDSSNSAVGVLLDVLPGTKTSTTTVASNLNPWAFGQPPVTFSATVTPPSGGQATGTITFYDGWIEIGSASLVNNVATLGGVTPAYGYHMITARYGGDSNTPPSNSAQLIETSDLAATTTSLVSSVNPSYPNQSVSFTATVAGQFGGPVTGTVVFAQGKKILATITLANGQAVYTTTFSAPGTHKIYAVYYGDANNLGSSSPVVKQTVKPLPAATSTTVTTSGSPSKIGQPVTFTAVVSSNLPVPDGETVAFYNGKIEIGTGTLANGTASATTSFSKAGKFTIKAIYPGDTSHKTSSGTVNQIVNP
jgi:hypothetical protein